MADSDRPSSAFVEELQRALARPETGGAPIPGLPDGEDALPALWGIQYRLEQAYGDQTMADIREQTRRWLAGDDTGGDDGPRSA